MNSRQICNHLCEGADPKQQTTIRRVYGLATEPPTDEDLVSAATLLVAAALKGHPWAIIAMGNGLDGEAEISFTKWPAGRSERVKNANLGCTTCL